MKCLIYVFSLLLTVTFISCNDGRQDEMVKEIEVDNADTAGEIRNQITAFKTDSIINNLQGKWKETEYPFRMAHFENTSVKFIEEGVAEESAFVEYTISNECPFEVNNLKNASGDDVFLVVAGSGTPCEILKVTENTLTLSGYNISTNSDYHIIYKKLQSN